MNAKRVTAAAGVILAAQKQKNTAAGIAASLEAAGVLQSPESAAELEQLRARVTELEAAAEAVRGQHYEVDGSFDEAGSCIQCGSDYPCATVQALFTEAPTRQADAPLAINQILAIEQDRPATTATHDCGIPLTRRLDCGHCPHEVCEDCDRCPHTCRCGKEAAEAEALAAVDRSIAAQFPLLAALRAEDPHDSPLHHPYELGRDLDGAL